MSSLPIRSYTLVRRPGRARSDEVDGYRWLVILDGDVHLVVELAASEATRVDPTGESLHARLPDALGRYAERQGSLSTRPRRLARTLPSPVRLRARHFPVSVR